MEIAGFGNLPLTDPGPSVLDCFALTIFLLTLAHAGFIPAQLAGHVWLTSGFVFGEGIQNYMNDGSVDLGALEPGNPDIAEELPIVGIVAFYDRTWNQHYTSTFGYSMVDIDNSAGQNAAAFRKGQYALANLLYHPVKNVMWGAELQWGKRENKGDGLTAIVDGAPRLIESSDDVRLQLSFKYNFGTRVGG